MLRLPGNRPLLLWLWAAAWAVACGAGTASAACEPRTVLVIHSYAPDYSWTRGQNDGIVAALAALPCAPHVRIEYLDSKYVQAEAYFAELAEIFASKYRGARIDGVITTDNAALTFAQDYGGAIFGRAPTVASGINGGGDDGPVRAPVVAVLPEVADHFGTLSAALRQNPGVETVYVVADSTVSGTAIGREIQDDIATAKLPVRMQYLVGRSFAEVEATVAALPRQAIVYLAPFFRDAADQAFPEGEVARRLAAVGPAPVYSSWASEIGGGAIGGRIVNGRHLGEEAAHALSRWLDGHAPPLPQTPLYVDLYDHAAATARGIPPDRLPDGAILLNRPPTLWERHSRILVPAGALIAMLGATLGLAVFTLRGQRMLNRGNARILAMNREIIDTQRELVATLGEVIEARSLETANHVRRVAAISRLLGAKIGLSATDLDILEGASPLHDVGKIGIPEEILAKPGRLTAAEFEIIKTHTTIGYRILQNSTRPLMQAACTIAHEHHERWDGQGYPRGITGSEIALMARITMLADVYDALLSERCYKRAWSEAEAIAYILDQRGAMFDPALVDILAANLGEVRAIRDALADDPGLRARLAGARAPAAGAPVSLCL